jgi:hypothetical protein
MNFVSNPMFVKVGRRAIVNTKIGSNTYIHHTTPRQEPSKGIHAVLDTGGGM